MCIISHFELPHAPKSFAYFYQAMDGKHSVALLHRRCNLNPSKLLRQGGMPLAPKSSNSLKCSSSNSSRSKGLVGLRSSSRLRHLIGMLLEVKCCSNSSSSSSSSLSSSSSRGLEGRLLKVGTIGVFVLVVVFLYYLQSYYCTYY